ncbi:MAG: hypothetical protein ACI9IP_003609, partial [Arcticibacterium sp.]
MAKATLFFDKRKNKSGKGTIKVLVTHERVQRLYSTRIQLPYEVWEKLQKNINANGLSSRLRDEAFIELYNVLYGNFEEFGKSTMGFIPRSNEIIENIGSNFSFDKFKHNFDNFGKTTNSIRTNDIYGFYDAVIRKLNKEERIGNANSYQNSMASLKRFCKNLEPYKRLEFGLAAKYSESEILPFDTVDVAFLVEYEMWMLTEGKRPKKALGKGSPASSTTIGIYLRHLRAIFNEAKEEGVTQCYPFGRKKYVIPSGRSVKKAITKVEVLKIINYDDHSNEFEERSKDFWVFS